MPRVDGLAFAPGLPPAGARVAADLDESGLRCLSDPPLDVPLAALRVELSGFDQDRLQLRWQAGEQEGAFVIDDRAALATLLRDAPPACGALLAEWTRLRTRARTRHAWTWRLLIGLLLLPVLLLLLALFSLDRLAGLAADRLPITWDAKLGAAAADSLMGGETPLRSGPAVAAVDQIAARLVAGLGNSPYSYKWHVLRSPTVNAMAAPGGYVMIYSGLLREAESPEEVAGVLAHEIQHVERRHAVRGLVKKLGIQAIAGLLFGGDGGFASQSGALAAELGGLKFDRDQESESDRLGVTLLRRARIDPAGMAVFFEKLAARGDAGALSYLSTHPDSAARAAAVRRLLVAEPATGVETLGIDWAEVRAALSE
ncbi:MAG: M48 family metallopeptidase [Planctomycetes bacterium]|nr:M48 family metallopeptidase [Planctomycetota bacterium]